MRFGYYPYDQKEIVMVGIDGVIGSQSLTVNSIYDFEVDDVFHYQGGGVQYQNFKEIHKILEENDSSFIVDICYYGVNKSSFGDEIFEGSYSITINKSDMIEEVSYSFSDRTYQCLDTSYSDVKNLFVNNFDCFLNSDTNIYVFGEGLGLIFRNNSTSQGIYYNSRMIYYKKANGEEWGNSLGSCETLSKEESIQSQISVFPNPSTELLNISNQNKSLINIEIYNSLGKLLLSEKGKSYYQLNISTWQKGMYLLQVKNSKGEVLKVEKISIIY